MRPLVSLLRWNLILQFILFGVLAALAIAPICLHPIRDLSSFSKQEWARLILSLAWSLLLLLMLGSTLWDIYRLKRGALPAYPLAWVICVLMGPFMRKMSYAPLYIALAASIAFTYALCYFSPLRNILFPRVKDADKERQTRFNRNFYIWSAFALLISIGLTLATFFDSEDFTQRRIKCEKCQGWKTVKRSANGQENQQPAEASE